MKYKKEFEKLNIKHCADKGTTPTMIADKAIGIDWLFGHKYDVQTNEIVGWMIGDTTDLEQRIINDLKLTKYEGILLQNNSSLLEDLIDPTFRRMRKECGGLISITTSQAKEIAARVKAVVESPVDDRDIITFANKTVDYKATRAQGKLVFTKQRIPNHNSVLWNVMTAAEIKASPKHMEMKDYLDKMVKGWGINLKLLGKIGAYTMIKENFADKVFFFKGEGGEGKGTANEMIRAMYAPSASKSYDPVNIKLGSEMAFVGSQIVFNDDIDAGKIQLTHIKPVATGGDIEIRPLYQSTRTVRPYATMIFNTNYDIKVGQNAVSKAWNDRQFVIEFKGKNYRGTEEAKEFKKIKPLENKYFMDVFVSLCASLIPTVIEEEFNDAQSVKIKNQEASLGSNIVKKFIDEFNPEDTYFDANSRVEQPLALVKNHTTVKELFNHFMNWAKASNETYRPNRVDFAKQFEYITHISMSTKPKSIDGKVQRWVDLSSIINSVSKQEVLAHAEFDDPFGDE